MLLAHRRRCLHVLWERVRYGRRWTKPACLLPPQSLVSGSPSVSLDAANAGRFLSGLRRRGDWPDAEQVAVYGTDPHTLLGTAHVVAGELIPGRLLSPIEIQQILENPLRETEAAKDLS